MLVSVVPIGNSKGIRIPKAVINELKIEDKVNLTISDDGIIITAFKKMPRQGWADAFAKMHKNEDDGLIISDNFENETVDWEW